MRLRNIVVQSYKVLTLDIAPQVDMATTKSSLEWTIEAAMATAVIKVRTDTAKLSDMRIAGFRK